MGLAMQLFGSWLKVLTCCEKKETHSFCPCPHTHYLYVHLVWSSSWNCQIAIWQAACHPHFHCIYHNEVCNNNHKVQGENQQRKSCFSFNYLPL